ncbi:MAG TPA: HAD-IA family hydrolase [Phototrophicaceae bacterium]|nr:HAD-IA family hydrolase [Phototrophicaceae bacterium]
MLPTTRLALKAVLFDLDDTLIDHQQSFRGALRRLWDTYPVFKQKPFATLETLHSQLLEALHQQVLAGQLTFEASRRKRFFELFLRYGVKLSQTDAEAASAVYRQAYLAAECPIPGAVAFLDYLRGQGIAIGVITNSTTVEQYDKVRRCGLHHLIDELVISEEVGVIKPNPAIFQLALSRLGCHPEDTVMIGDSWECDIVGALGAGIPALWLNRYARPCPDARFAQEFHGYEPPEMVVAAILKTITRV